MRRAIISVCITDFSVHLVEINININSIVCLLPNDIEIIRLLI